MPRKKEKFIDKDISQNEIIFLIFETLNFPCKIRYDSQFIFYYIYKDLKNKFNKINIILQSIVFACKLNKLFIEIEKLFEIIEKNDLYTKKIKKDENFLLIEIFICKKLNYNFQIESIYQKLIKLCTILEINKNTKLKNLDIFYCDDRVNRIEIVKKKKERVKTENESLETLANQKKSVKSKNIHPDEALISLFNENEIILIENIFCIEINRERIKKIRKDLLY